MNDASAPALGARVAQIERIRRGQTPHADRSATPADQEVVAA